MPGLLARCGPRCHRLARSGTRRTACYAAVASREPDLRAPSSPGHMRCRWLRPRARRRRGPGRLCPDDSDRGRGLRQAHYLRCVQRAVGPWGSRGVPREISTVAHPPSRPCDLRVTAWLTPQQRLILGSCDGMSAAAALVAAQRVSVLDDLPCHRPVPRRRGPLVAIHAMPAARRGRWPSPSGLRPWRHDDSRAPGR